MTAKEKALQLFHRFSMQWHASPSDIKLSCAICVDEVIAVLDEVSIGESGRTKIDFGQSYWNDVKQAINDL